MAATMAKARALQKLLGDQARAAAPDAHVWLSASAGTGKTHVLTARVFRLLLQGCLLYTSPSPRDGLLSRMPSSA